ncbi:hypothetical protein BX070DRAFT_156331 [Coemansia spiralis]|nr:hypothetical protein BX070DRAFT_156331 [Coemansia spiralis]
MRLALLCFIPLYFTSLSGACLHTIKASQSNGQTRIVRFKRQGKPPGTDATDTAAKQSSANAACACGVEAHWGCLLLCVEKAQPRTGTRKLVCAALTVEVHVKGAGEKCVFRVD